MLCMMCMLCVLWLPSITITTTITTTIIITITITTITTDPSRPIHRDRRRRRYLTLVWHYLYHYLPAPEDDAGGMPQFALQPGSMYGGGGLASTTMTPDGLLLLYVHVVAHCRALAG